MHKSEYALIEALEEIKVLKAQVNYLREQMSTCETYRDTDVLSKTPLHCLNQVKADTMEMAADLLFMNGSKSKKSLMMLADKTRNSNE